MTDPPDIARIGRDPDAFEVFYRAHVDAVSRFVTRRVDDPYLAADLTVDVFVAAVDAARKATAVHSPPLAWLYGVARNVVAAERRRRAREQRAVRRLAGHAMVDEHDVVRLMEKIDAEAQARSLYQAMDELSQSERAVLELVALDGLALHEVAVVLGIGPAAARKRLHRARQRLRVELPPTVFSHALLEVAP
jgi:RNA polymerase sigma-70 factor (ECF subfamily)